MKNIINLSDIIDINIENSIKQFAILAKTSGVTPLDCGGLFSKTLGVVPLIKAALLYYNSTINAYKLGKITTTEFINNCLNVVFKCPVGEDRADWDNKLTHAWNAMISIDQRKTEDFIEYINDHQEGDFILITNSNDMQISFVLEKLKTDFNIMFDLISPDELTSKKDNPLCLISSHTAGTFKTDNMIKEIVDTLGSENINVFTKYENDIKYCRQHALNCTLINENFDYRTFNKDIGKCKLN